MRIVRRVPDLLDHFTERTKQLLSDKNHGVLLCGVTLAIEICQSDAEALQDFRQDVPLLVRHLKALVTTGYSPEHDVSGITDPFLQVERSSCRLAEYSRSVQRGGKVCRRR